MADLRVTGGANLPAAKPTQLSESARAAQRAFFQAALNGVAAPAAAASATIKPATAVQPAITPSKVGAERQPDRFLRPGSLLDIKV